MAKCGRDEMVVRSEVNSSINVEKRQRVVRRIWWAINVDDCEATWRMVESDGGCVKRTVLW